MLPDVRHRRFTVRKPAFRQTVTGRKNKFFFVIGAYPPSLISCEFGLSDCRMRAKVLRNAA